MNVPLYALVDFAKQYCKSYRALLDPEVLLQIPNENTLELYHEY